MWPSKEIKELKADVTPKNQYTEKDIEEWLKEDENEEEKPSANSKQEEEEEKEEEEEALQSIRKK